MDFFPKSKQELVQSLQRQRDFKVDLVFTGTVPEIVAKVKELKSGTYTIIVIKR